MAVTFKAQSIEQQSDMKGLAAATLSLSMMMFVVPALNDVFATLQQS